MLTFMAFIITFFLLAYAITSPNHLETKQQPGLGDQNARALKFLLCFQLVCFLLPHNVSKQVSMSHTCLVGQKWQ